MNDKLAEALKRFWAETSPALCDHGADVANALEAKYDIRLPEDFKAYLVEGSPAEEAMRGRGFSLWAPERIKSMPDECHSETPLDQINPVIQVEANRYLVFSDFLVWCYAYAICCSEGPNRGKVAIIGDGGDRLVADNFYTFIEMAAQNAGCLHPRPPNAAP